MNLDTPKGMAAACAWQRNLLNMVKHGGTWVVPRSMTVLRVDHEKKVLVRVSGQRCEPTITRVCNAIGWKVIEQ